MGARSLRLSLSSAADVFDIRDGFEVAWFATRWIATQMVDCQAGGDGAELGLVGEAVRGNLSARVIPKSGIALSVGKAAPDETVADAFASLCQALDRGALRGHAAGAEAAPDSGRRTLFSAIAFRFAGDGEADGGGHLRAAAAIWSSIAADALRVAFVFLLALRCIQISRTQAWQAIWSSPPP